MLRKISWPHHLLVLAGVSGAAGLALLGLIGEPWRTEQYDQRQVVVMPADPTDERSDALRIIELIDQDFADEQRRGHERYIPNDFGAPIDVTARSATAPDAVRVERISAEETRIRIGRPDQTITGQHRYELGFTLPSARLSSGQLAVDIIGTEEELETGRFEVVVTGLILEATTCNVGAQGVSGGCTLERDGDVYRAVISPLRPGEGITIGGQIVSRTSIEMPAALPLPEPVEVPNRRGPLALGVLLIGLIAATGVHLLMQRSGRNEVFAGGAADAAFGSLPAPGPDGLLAASSVTMVSDRRLGDRATIEFAPPQGLEPWQGAVLLQESINDSTVGAWFSGLAGSEAISMIEDGKTLVIEPGRHRDRLQGKDAALVDKMFQSKDRLKLKGYNKKFAEVWSEVSALQREQISTSGWWTKLSPGQGGLGATSLALVAVIAGALALLAGWIFLAFFGLFFNVVLALVFGLVVGALIAVPAYHQLLPARSATGSALALRTESFRRFLEASEGQHVQWAWERGVIREYSAWAVALGQALAWSKAMESSSVVPADPSIRSPLLVATMASTLSQSHTAPSTSGSGSSSGGFSGGSVGGGGGGGRSGSW